MGDFQTELWQGQQGAKGRSVSAEPKVPGGLETARESLRLNWGTLVSNRTKPAKLAPNAPRGRPKRLNQAFFPRPKTFLQRGLRSTGGPKLLKRGFPGRGSNLLKSRRLLMSQDPPVLEIDKRRPVQGRSTPHPQSATLRACSLDALSRLDPSRLALAYVEPWLRAGSACPGSGTGTGWPRHPHEGRGTVWLQSASH